MNSEKKPSAIIVYGTSWCPDVVVARRFLDQRGVEYEYLDIDANKEAMDALFEISGVDWLVPTVVFPDGSVFSNPSKKELAGKLRRQKKKNRSK
jgi:glutaredoxin